MADAQVASEWTAPTGKGRWSKKAGRAMVEAWRQSGESRAAFARRYGLGVHRVTYWISRLDGLDHRARQSSHRQSPEVTFAPVRVVNAELPSACTLDVVIGAAVVRVPPVFDEAHLRRVVSALGGITC